VEAASSAFGVQPKADNPAMIASTATTRTDPKHEKGDFMVNSFLKSF
jgi:hypothetical protein